MPEIEKKILYFFPEIPEIKQKNPHFFRKFRKLAEKFPIFSGNPGNSGQKSLFFSGNRNPGNREKILYFFLPGNWWKISGNARKCSPKVASFRVGSAPQRLTFARILIENATTYYETTCNRTNVHCADEFHTFFIL